MEENGKFRKPIYADELWENLRERHDIHPKNLGQDPRTAPAVKELQEQFAESIQHKLIGGRVIPREETGKIIESIKAGKDVILHGAAGFGKSGALYELTEYLQKEQIPYLPIRLDRRIPEKTAAHFGVDMGLPDSPAFALEGLAVERKGILILDQLDAIRWTAAHSGAAMDVCKELLRQVRSLRQLGKSIFIVFASRTFDLENDPEIKNLIGDKGKNSFAKISAKALSGEQLKAILGSDFPSLTESQKRILACPQNLAMWLEIKDSGITSSFRSATELMCRFWENRRTILEKEAGLSAGQLDSVLSPLVNYMESRGTVSAPTRISEKNPSVQDSLISYGILQKSAGRISFCHGFQSCLITASFNLGFQLKRKSRLIALYGSFVLSPRKFRIRFQKLWSRLSRRAATGRKKPLTHFPGK